VEFLGDFFFNFLFPFFAIFFPFFAILFGIIGLWLFRLSVAHFKIITVWLIMMNKQT